MSGCAAGDPADVQELIEATGFGAAQYQTLCLAHGIWLVESLMVGQIMVLTAAVAADLRLTGPQGASISSLVFTGIAIGNVVSGFLGDRLGRLPPVLLSYVLATALHISSASASGYRSLALLRTTLGVALGLGMPASLALVSESSPASGRKLLQGLRGVIFGLGSIIGAVILCTDDATYSHLQWRRDVLLSTVPAVVLGGAAFLLLRESPVFLAATGRQMEAMHVLASMRRLNGVEAPAAGCTLASRPWEKRVLPCPRNIEEEGSKTDWRHQLSTIFSRHLASVTITLAFGAFTVNLVLYGHGYAFPKVAKDIQASMPPGYQGLLQNCIGIPVGLLVSALATLLSCRDLMLISAFVGSLGPALFAWAGSRADLGLLYLVAQNLPGVSAAFGFLACFQLAVDLFPVQTSATSAAIVVAAGRLGAILAPLAFESFTDWQSFYHLMSALSAASLAMAMVVLPCEPSVGKADPELGEAAAPLRTAS